MLTIGVSGKKGKEKTFPNYFDKMTKKTKIGLIQLKISKNIELNLKNAISKIKELMEKNSELEKSIKSSQQKELGEVIKSLEQDIIQINSYKVILKEFEGINLGSARSFIDELKNKNKNLICVLASKDGDKSSLLVSSSKSIPKDVFSSNDLLQSLSLIHI